MSADGQFFCKAYDETLADINGTAFVEDGIIHKKRTETNFGALFVIC